MTGCNRCDHLGDGRSDARPAAPRPPPAGSAGVARRKEASRASRTCTQSSPRYQAVPPLAERVSREELDDLPPAHASPARSAARNSHLKTCARGEQHRRRARVRGGAWCLRRGRSGVRQRDHLCWGVDRGAGGGGRPNRARANGGTAPAPRTSARRSRPGLPA